MSTIVIRALTEYEERVGVVHRIGAYAFGSSPPLDPRENLERWLRNMPDATILAAFEGEQAVAISASSPFTQNVRGQIWPMSGIWGVATLPGARRNGHIRRLMADLLRREYEEGMPVSCLYPFRPSFYERMGYVSFPQPRTAKIDPRPLAPLLRMSLGGAVQLLPIKDGHAIYRAYLLAQQRRIHGMAVCSEPAALNEASRDHWLAVARVAGEPVGAMIYVISGEEDRRVMRVHRFYTHTAAGLYLLLEWFARHIDQVEHIEVRLPPAELPETWWPDLATLKTERVWPPMGRVLDVARIGGMAAGTGRFTARISDPLCPWNEGIWTFAGEGGSLTVTPAAGAAECALTIQGLSALVYGAHDPALFAMLGWGDPAPEVQAVMRAIFPGQLPYLHEEF